MKAERLFQVECVAFGLLVAAAGCNQRPPSGSLVLTKAPASAAVDAAANLLDARYPIGSRVVLREPPFDSRHERILSGNLAAAGDPVVSNDGQRVFFVGKATPASDWQIYATQLVDWGPRVLTAMPGGAMSPTLLPNGSLVFISPVPKRNPAEASGRAPALFAQPPGTQPRRLTFGTSPIIDATVLSDGRILFATLQIPPSGSTPECTLYTINNDGTEVTRFTEGKIQASLIEQPRQISDGRVVFLVSQAGADSSAGRAEFVNLARPCLNGSLLLSNLTARAFSVQPGGDDDVLICAQGPPGNPTLPAVFRVGSSAASLGLPLIADPKRGFGEAVEAAAHRPPMGRLSTVDFTKRTGKILCLDVNFTRETSEKNQPMAAASRVRVTAEVSPGVVRSLGEVAVQADGSFLAEVPADIALGFEVTDESGRILRRESPSMWVRPGENRSCLGCHEPANRTPHNRRPLAVNVPVPCLTLKDAKLAAAK